MKEYTSLTNRECVAVWNVLMFSTRTLGNKEGLAGEITRILVELNRRCIPVEMGKRIKLVGA